MYKHIAKYLLGLNEARVFGAITVNFKVTQDQTVWLTKKSNTFSTQYRIMKKSTQGC